MIPTLKQKEFQENEFGHKLNHYERDNIGYVINSSKIKSNLD
jgi:hypothetical protein